jgi:DNA-binding response OmpR family regulator
VQPTVLIVDDDNSIRTVITINLQVSGFSVLEAPDGKTALRMLERESVDIALVDVMMPGMSGWELADALRDGATTPFVFVSAKAGTDDQLRGLELGALDFVTKPFDPLELAVRLQELLDALERGEAEQLRQARLERLLAVTSPGTRSAAPPPTG